MNFRFLDSKVHFYFDEILERKYRPRARQDGSCSFESEQRTPVNAGEAEQSIWTRGHRQATGFGHRKAGEYDS